MFSFTKKKKTTRQKVNEKMSGLLGFFRPRKKKAPFFWLGSALVAVAVGAVSAVHEYFLYKQKNGFTMIELLIGLALVGFLSTTGIYGYQTSQTRARDAQRKNDLSDIKVAFENYYNDNGCYPAADSGFLEQCGQPFFTYMEKTPCDPRTGEPYVYRPLDNECTGYRLYAGLEVHDDPDSVKVGCSGADGCGFGPEYNYGISEGVAVYNADGTYTPATPAPTGGPQATPTGPLYVYACDTAGICNQFAVGHPALQTCPVTFQQTDCNNECSNPALRCQ
jgi:prepilin-type N-terminal cleavage/methylation domain-containing protein